MKEVPYITLEWDTPCNKENVGVAFPILSRVILVHSLLEFIELVSEHEERLKQIFSSQVIEEYFSFEFKFSSVYSHSRASFQSYLLKQAKYRDFPLLENRHNFRHFEIMLYEFQQISWSVNLEDENLPALS